MRISDWSSDVCSSDLPAPPGRGGRGAAGRHLPRDHRGPAAAVRRAVAALPGDGRDQGPAERRAPRPAAQGRSEEHTSELQSLMRISYAVFCLKKKKHYYTYITAIAAYVCRAKS